MIITKFRLQETNPVGVGLPFIDLDVDSFAGANGYLLKDSDGLDPPNVKAIVEGFDLYGVPIMDNASDPRDITFKIGLKPNNKFSVSSLRSALYKFMSRSITLTLLNKATPVAEIKGYVSKLDSPQFSHHPEVDLTISCETAEFISPFAVQIPLVELEKASPLIGYSEGDAPTGFEIEIKWISATPGTGFYFMDYGKFWYKSKVDYDPATYFGFEYELIEDDVLTIITNKSSRKLTLTRGVDVYDLVGYLNPGAVWPKLFSGLNSFTWAYDATKTEILSAKYYPRFWGV